MKIPFAKHLPKKEGLYWYYSSVGWEIVYIDTHKGHLEVFDNGTGCYTKVKETKAERWSVIIEKPKRNLDKYLIDGIN